MLRKTAFFLILLRLAIGWHFLFEGWHKIHTHQIGKDAETNKMFSSEGYFREASGPLGPVVRRFLDDPDEQTLARLKLAAGDPDKEESPGQRVPAAMAKEIDDYLNRFLDTFVLDDTEKGQAKAKAAQTKSNVVLWLEYKFPEKIDDRDKEKDKLWHTVKRSSPDGKTNEVSLTAAERIEEYRAKVAEMRELRDRKMFVFLRDVDKQRLLKTRGDVNTYRAEFVADLDKQMAFLRDGLSDILKSKFDRLGTTLPEVPAGEEALTVWLPSSDGEKLPGEYAEIWEKYYETFTSTYKLGDEQKEAAAEKFKNAKKRMAQWLAKKETRQQIQVKYDQMAALTAFGLALSPLTAATAMAPHQEGVRSEILGQTKQMRTSLDTVLTDDQFKGIPPKPEPGKTFIWWVDRITMWALFIMGVCLLAGFFTRTNCVLAGGFLLTTYLLHPSFPWVPTPPNNEGNYFFVNKNVVEMFALFALATTMTGRWFGLDGLLESIFGRKEPSKTLPTVKRAA